MKLVLAGARQSTDGTIGGAGSIRDYWFSTVNAFLSWNLEFGSLGAYMNSDNRALGLSACCLKK